MSSFVTLTMLFGALYLIDVTMQSEAMSCHYRYDIQPGPTTEICPLNGHSETALILKCQVSNDRGPNFSIIWHHKTSIPESSDIADPKTIINNSSTTDINIKATLQNSQTSLTSQLTLYGFDDKGAGYYWCSVNSSRDAQTNNPSTILHITYNIHCKANNEQHCTRNVNLYANSSSRCADQEISIETQWAQNCSSITTQVEEKPIDDSSFTPNPNPDLPTQTSSQQGTSPITTNLRITSMQPTPQQNTSPSSKFQLSMGVIIGASMGGLVLILFTCFIIGLLLTCVVRVKSKHRARQHRLDDPTSPFDDIRMYSSIAKLTQEKVDDANRISKLYCESNTAYECSPHTLTSSQTENIYEYIS